MKNIDFIVRELKVILRDILQSRSGDIGKCMKSGERQKQLKHGEISMIIGFKENNNNNYSNVVTTVIINSHGEFTIYFYMYIT